MAWMAWPTNGIYLPWAPPHVPPSRHHHACACPTPTWLMLHAAWRTPGLIWCSKVTVWYWSGPAGDEGPEAAAFFTQFLGVPCRLARYLGDVAQRVGMWCW